MKNSLLLLIAIFLFAPKLDAQRATGFVEWQNILPISEGEEGLFVIKGQLQSKWDDKAIGFNAFFLVNPDWAQGILGMTWQPKETLDEFNFTLGAGVETDDVPFRAQTSLYLRSGRFTNLAVFELGGSGYWYLLVPQVYLTEFIEIGVHLERFVGVGPQIELSSGNFSAWISPSYNFENAKYYLNTGMNAFF